jgi:hypothetical protein
MNEGKKVKEVKYLGLRNMYIYVYIYIYIIVQSCRIVLL